MKKFLTVIAVFALAAIVTACTLLVSKPKDATTQDEQPSNNYAASQSLPPNIPDTQAVEKTATTPAAKTDTPAAPKAKADILLVNADNPLPEGYQPESLINLYEQKNRSFQLAKADISVCQTVFDAMNAMFSAAANDGVDGFIISSGYRSNAEQAAIFHATTDGTAAKPGTSEHETGLAFDVTAMGDPDFSLMPQFEWLSKHCAEYGFILRYPQGKEGITGYPYEPWHYRYVGVTAAKAIMGEGLALEEYLNR